MVEGSGISVWVSILLFIASVPLEVAGSYLYHIPWTCSVTYSPADRAAAESLLIGACAIIEQNKVLVSVDNFLEMIPDSNPPMQYFRAAKDIRVHAGSNYMDPTRLTPRPVNAQTREVGRIFVAFKKAATLGGEWIWKVDPLEIHEGEGAVFDAYGLEFNVGVLEITKPFTRSTYVLPMLIHGPDVPQKTDAYIKKLEHAAGLPRSSCITYSHNRLLQSITCACFQSVQYVDVCPKARGAALYCDDFDKSVFAILTTAPSCGQRNMPGVYTTMPQVIDFFEKIICAPFKPESRTSYDLFSLPQQNSDYTGVE